MSIVTTSEQHKESRSIPQNDCETSSRLKRPIKEENFESMATPAKRAIAANADSSFLNSTFADSASELILIPEGAVGLVIGRSGCEIQNIQATSGCRVQMNPDHSSANGLRACSLQGTPASIEVARSLISDVVARAALRQSAMQTPTSVEKTSVTVDMSIPATKCGLVIGKNGDTIRMLQEKSGCKMQIVQDSQQVTGQPKPLRIVGEPHEIEAAKRLVEEIMSSDNNVQHSEQRFSVEQPTAKGEVIVPRSSVGMIIGKGGETIKRVAGETGTKIQFKQDDDTSSAERCAVITGTREQIYKATEMITELVNRSMLNASTTNRATDVVEVFYMHVPSTKTGLIIGKGGETIKQINCESGAHCELSKETHANGEEKVFIIKGTPNQIHLAQHLIRLKVGDVPANTPIPPLSNRPAHVVSNFSHEVQHPYQMQPVPANSQWTGPRAEQWPQAPNNMGYPHGIPAAYMQPQGATGSTSQNFAVVAETSAQNSAPAANQAQPTINPQTGQPDYSAQWAEYYRSVGLFDQAAMVESQMKQNAAGSSTRSFATQSNSFTAGSHQKTAYSGYTPSSSQANPASFGGSMMFQS